ncbi:MAG: hypothetical protein SF097_04595 [Acidobacteriota bacterium]|nr:hypothetical protein [Acidobacteriota bacterium]
MVIEKSKKLTRRRRPQIACDKKPIAADAYYTIREVTSPDSPFWLCSPATIFRALKSGALKPNYSGRKVLLKGERIHAWLSGEEVMA